MVSARRRFRIGFECFHWIRTAASRKQLRARTLCCVLIGNSPSLLNSCVIQPIIFPTELYMATSNSITRWGFSRKEVKIDCWYKSYCKKLLSEDRYTVHFLRFFFSFLFFSPLFVFVSPLFLSVFIFIYVCLLLFRFLFIYFPHSFPLQLFFISFFLFLFPLFWWGGVGWGNEAQFVFRSSDTQICYGRRNTTGCGFLKTGCRETKVTYFYYF